MILKYMNWKNWVTAILCAVFLAIQVYFDLKIPEYMSALTDAIVDSGSSSAVYEIGKEMALCAIIDIY